MQIGESWRAALAGEFEADYFQRLTDFVREEYGAKTIFPPAKAIFRAFDMCPLEEVKVVIIGQDPYHGPGQANGLCFAVNEGVPNPPSLQNIFKEIEADLGERPQLGDLLSWARQGVLLLNATLTVAAHQAASHQGKGWERFTDRAIEAVSAQREGVVFMLWGRFAQDKRGLIDESKHLVLTAAHPSPLSAYKGFFGCGHFSKANQYLAALGKETINWIK